MIGKPHFVAVGARDACYAASLSYPDQCTGGTGTCCIGMLQRSPRYQTESALLHTFTVFQEKGGLACSNNDLLGKAEAQSRHGTAGLGDRT